MRRGLTLRGRARPRLLAISRWAAAAAAVGSLVVGASACAAPRGDRGSEVQPLGGLTDPGADDHEGEDPVQDGSAAVTTIAPSTTRAGGRTAQQPTPPPDDDIRTPGSDAAAVAVVDAVLTRYDVVLAELSAEPAVRTVPGHPALLAWDAVVLPGSSLSTAMLASLRRRANDGSAVRPSEEGVTHRHRALVVSEQLESAISFTWCGYSPGIAVNVSSGEVLDDAVAVTHGTGQVRSLADGWYLESLDQFDSELIDDHEPDPCTAEVARAQNR